MSDIETERFDEYERETAKLPDKDPDYTNLGPVLSSQLSQLNRHREKMNSPEYEVVESVVNSIRAKFAEQEQNRYGVLRAGWLAGEWCCVLAGALRRIKRRDEAMHELRKVVDILQDGPTGDIMYERLRTRAMAVAIPLDTDLIEQIRVAGVAEQHGEMEVSPAPLSPAYKPMSITGTPLASAELDKAFSLGPALHEPTETTFVPQEPIDAGQISRVVLLNLRIDFLTPEEADKVRVFITGNHETVGFWNPVEGLELRRVGVNEWEAPMPVKPEQVGKLQFKAVIIRPDAEPQFEREHRENRVWHGESRLDFTWEA